MCGKRELIGCGRVYGDTVEGRLVYTCSHLWGCLAAKPLILNKNEVFSLAWQLPYQLVRTELAAPAWSGGPLNEPKTAQYPPDCIRHRRRMQLHRLSFGWQPPIRGTSDHNTRHSRRHGHQARKRPPP